MICILILFQDITIKDLCASARYKIYKNSRPLCGV